MWYPSGPGSQIIQKKGPGRLASYKDTIVEPIVRDHSKCMGEEVAYKKQAVGSLSEKKSSQIHFLANNLLHVISKLLIVFGGKGLCPPWPLSKIIEAQENSWHLAGKPINGSVTKCQLFSQAKYTVEQ